ncbi:thrombospondin type-1 domain-containing protein 4-like [Cochliomyia hominivorax]
MYSGLISLSFYLLLISPPLTLSDTSDIKFSNLVNDGTFVADTTFSNFWENFKTSRHLLEEINLIHSPSLKSPRSVEDKTNKNSKSNKKSQNTDDDYEEDYDDGDTEEDGGDENETTAAGGGAGGGGGRNNSRQRHIYIIKRVGITYAWGRWEKWSRCSNSCVQIRKRQCIKRIQNSTDSEAVEITFYPDLAAETTGCFGIMKKYRMCKDEKCKFSNRQMRDEQCSSFNRQPYKGKFYTWQGYEKEHNECELYCRPIDSDIFISMNQSVTDGTPCEKPAIYYTHYYRRKAVCVEGICKAVHSSGAIRPATTKDSQEKCGSVLCRKVSEIFSQSKLNHGYNFITTIPAGAMNVTIKQMAKSSNLIALKTTDDIYIINGNNKASEGGIFLYDDDVYDYNKDTSTILAKGPLRKPVKLMLLVRSLNPGISYTYTLPVASASISEPEELQSQWNELGQPLDEIDENYLKGSPNSQLARIKEKKRRRFSWELLGFGPCNRSCGRGIQLPIFRCIRDSPTKESLARYYSPKRCAFIEKPQFSEDIYHCNYGLCPAYWRPTEYGECECQEDETEGVRSRKLQCVQEQASGSIEEVEESKCKSEKLPDLKETCNCQLMAKRKLYARNPENANKMYSKLIGSPGAVRNVIGKRHLNVSLAPPLRRFHRDDRLDKAGVWLMSDWSQQCSADCNANYEYRTIYCDRTAPYTDLCDARLTPEQKRTCSTRSCHQGSWFTSEWSNCTGECFNLHRTRMVLCIMDGFVVDAGQCPEETKPLDKKNCTRHEVEFCGPKWHYSEWSECSRTCGDGVQRRYAKCLEFDWKQNAMIESNKCKYLEREPVYGACSLAKCEELKQQHKASTAAAASAAVNAHQTADDASDREQLQNDDHLSYGMDADDVVGGGGGVNKYFIQRDLAAGKEKLVIAAAPQSLKNCNDELNNCKRINRERLCKLEFYKTYCCLTCHGYY